ncbi:hypothetical protein B0H14DRAFT_2967785 [Mycena olivaceomarginata]|nr:hypothetical protein B0H14DRAFT_2967785 [Mycena olivaceomarginata]
MAIREAAGSGATQSYRYPVLTLPNEIVGQIFAHVLPIHRAPSVQTPPLRGPDSPTLLAQICRQWRDVALETPALWRALSLNDASIPSEHLCTLVEDVSLLSTFPRHRRRSRCPRSTVRD